MAPTQMRLEYPVVIEDPEHWSEEHLAACAKDTSSESYEEWVTTQLDDVMRAAGEDFIQRHPDLFAYGEFL